MNVSQILKTKGDMVFTISPHETVEAATALLFSRRVGAMVVMDEAGIGNDAAHLRETDESLMHRGHDLWLATLKWTAEGK